MIRIATALASAIPSMWPKISKTAALPGSQPDLILDIGRPADRADGFPMAEQPFDRDDSVVDELSDLLRERDEVTTAESKSFNNRLQSLLSERRELPFNDRRRLNALLAEVLRGREDLLHPERRDVPAEVIASF